LPFSSPPSLSILFAQVHALVNTLKYWAKDSSGDDDNADSPAVPPPATPATIGCAAAQGFGDDATADATPSAASAAALAARLASGGCGAAASGDAADDAACGAAASPAVAAAFPAVAAAAPAPAAAAASPILGADGLVTPEAMRMLEATPELDYLTHIVIRLYENFRFPTGHPRRHRVEILFSPGASFNPFDGAPRAPRKKDFSIAPAAAGVGAGAPRSLVAGAVTRGAEVPPSALGGVVTGGPLLGAAMAGAGLGRESSSAAARSRCGTAGDDLLETSVELPPDDAGSTVSALSAVGGGPLSARDGGGALAGALASPPRHRLAATPLGSSAHGGPDSVHSAGGAGAAAGAVVDGAEDGLGRSASALSAGGAGGAAASGGPGSSSTGAGAGGHHAHAPTGASSVNTGRTRRDRAHSSFEGPKVRPPVATVYAGPAAASREEIDDHTLPVAGVVPLNLSVSLQEFEDVIGEAIFYGATLQEQPTAGQEQHPKDEAKARAAAIKARRQRSQANGYFLH
jgi:hypothetical protein